MWRWQLCGLALVAKTVHGSHCVVAQSHGSCVEVACGSAQVYSQEVRWAGSVNRICV